MSKKELSDFKDLDHIFENMSPEEEEKFLKSVWKMLVEMEIRDRALMQRVNEAVFGKDKDNDEEDGNEI